MFNRIRASIAGEQSPSSPEKNEEFHALARAKEERETSIRNYELDKRDREEWEQSRREEFSLS